MAVQTSDDEFGYDFETDDEELLIQLASTHSPPLKSTDDVNRAVVPASGTAKKTTSSFEALGEVTSSQKYVYRSYASPSNGFATKEKISTSTSMTDEKQSISSPSVSAAVVYPDREYTPDSPISVRQAAKPRYSNHCSASN